MSRKDSEGARLPPTRLVSVDRIELYNHRVALGLSQGELSRRAGISRSYLSEIEAGDKQPRMAVARSIAQALGVELSQITDHST